MVLRFLVFCLGGKLKIIFILCSLSVFLGTTKNCEQQSLEPKIDAKESELTLGCKNDEDCSTISVGCCDCRRGGKQKAILHSKKEQEVKVLEVKCNDVMCAQMISKDASCKQKPVCINNVCSLK